MKKITVFTPTYNRAYILRQCYNALIKQTCKEFVWMIVDDGSNDDTRQIVESFIKEKKICIRYIYQKNQGKYKATNNAIKNCKTELFAFVDSDDFYKDDTVEIMLKTWDKYKKNNIAGIVGRRCDKNNKIIGNLNDFESRIINFTTLVSKYNYYGDTCRVYKTDILLKNIYPEIDEKFIPENVLFGKIDEKYNIYFLNEALSVSEYLDDGYTNSYKKLLLNNPNGYRLSLIQSIRNETKIISKLKLMISYITWSKRHKFKKIYKDVRNKLLFIIAMPLAYVCLVLGLPTWHTPKGGLINKLKIYYKTIYCFIETFNGSKAKILTDRETVEYIIKNEKSIIRFGDGEFNLLNEIDISYQKASKKLKKELEDIVNNYDKNSNYILCMPKFFMNSSGFKILKRNWISSWSFSRYCFMKNFDQNQIYGDAFLFAEGNEQIYKKIWERSKFKNCIFIHNNEKYAYEFEEKYKIKTFFIKAPEKNAYESLTDILYKIENQLSKVQIKNTFIISSMGPASKILVYRLKDRIRVFDTGHCFDFPLKSK